MFYFYKPIHLLLKFIKYLRTINKVVVAIQVQYKEFLTYLQKDT